MPRFAFPFVSDLKNNPMHFHLYLSLCQNLNHKVFFCTVHLLIEMVCIRFVLFFLSVPLVRSSAASLSWCVTLATPWTSAHSISAQGRCSWVNWTKTDNDSATTLTVRQRWGQIIPECINCCWTLTSPMVTYDVCSSHLLIIISVMINKY